MLLSIKPHSTLQKYFIGDNIKADVQTYSDLFYYLRALQPKFHAYSKAVLTNKVQEGFTFLDKNLKELSSEEMQIRLVKPDDIVYIVPAIVGGGGKRGNVLSILAIAALFFVAGPLAGALSPASAAGVAATEAAVAGAGAVGQTLAAVKAGGFLSQVVVNVGLAALSSLFMSPTGAAEETRQNNMFGSLSNSTNTGTPVALHYGMVRAAGQLISGYIYTSEHGKTAEINTYGEVIDLTSEEQTGVDSSQYTVYNSSLGTYDSNVIDNITQNRDLEDYVGP